MTHEHPDLLRPGIILHGHNHRCLLCGSLHAGGDTCIVAEVVPDAYGPGQQGVRFIRTGNTLCPKCKPGGEMTRMLRKKLDQRTDLYHRRLQQMMRERDL